MMDRANAEKRERQALYREMTAKLFKMSALLRALGLTFSQDASRRDLQLAELLSGTASDLERPAIILWEDGPAEFEFPTGTFNELLDRSISQAAVCDAFSLAADLERLGEAVKGGVEEIAQWKSYFEAKQTKARSVGSVVPSELIRGRRRHADSDRGNTWTH